MIVSITIDGGELADPAKVIPQVLEEALTKSVLLLERAIKPKVPIGVTGAARGSIAGEVRMGGAAPKLGPAFLPGDSFAMGEMLGMVGSPIPYVAVVNDGRRPGQKMPNPKALELWVRRKIQWSTRKGPRGGRKRLTDAEARSVAWIIAKRIGERGIEGKHFYEEALSENQDQIRGFFEAAGLKISMRLTQPS